MSCAAPPNAAPGPATGPLPPLVARPSLASPAAVALSDAGSAVETPNPPEQAPSTGLELVIDLPYPSDARPRPSDPQAMALDDEAWARWNAGGSAAPNAAPSQASFHPGTRVVVDTRAAKLRAGSARRAAPKGLTLDRVQAQTRSRGYWPFRLCFETGQRDKPGTGGEARVAFSIGVRGKVTATRLLDSKLGNPATAACYVKELSKLEYTPRPAQKLAMVATIAIYPGDAEVAPTPPPAAAPGQAPPGDFVAETMRERVLEQRARLEACFADAQRADPLLWGRLALSVILEVDGSVHRINEIESHFPSASAARCAAAAVSTLSFPSVNGKPFTFVVPLRLKPLATAPETKQPSPDRDPSPADAPSDSGT